jgi:hypothetical protein
VIDTQHLTHLRKGNRRNRGRLKRFRLEGWNNIMVTKKKTTTTNKKSSSSKNSRQRRKEEEEKRRRKKRKQLREGQEKKKARTKKHKKQKVRKKIRAEIRMISGCEDAQTSAVSDSRSWLVLDVDPPCTYAITAKHSSPLFRSHLASRMLRMSAKSSNYPRPTANLEEPVPVPCFLY